MAAALGRADGELISLARDHAERTLGDHELLRDALGYGR